MKFPRLHGVMVGGLDGKLYTVFDPRWSIHLWVWWVWKCWAERWLRRVVRAMTPWRTLHKASVFTICFIEFRYNGKAHNFRAWSNRVQYLSWMPEEDSAATRVAVVSPWLEQPTDETHPLERGL